MNHDPDLKDRVAKPPTPKKEPEPPYGSGKKVRKIAHPNRGGRPVTSLVPIGTIGEVVRSDHLAVAVQWPGAMPPGPPSGAPDQAWPWWNNTYPYPEPLYVLEPVDSPKEGGA